MALKLMYITNKPEIAKIAEQSGVDYIFIDMEYIGKDIRQKGLNTVQNHHTIDDIRNMKRIVSKSSVLVRINPIHGSSSNYKSSEDEINLAINAGADVLMLPYFKTVEEVKYFISCVAGRVKTCLLLETPEAVVLIDSILNIKGIDMIHIGLNDLHLALKMKFMFQVLSDGIVEYLGNKIKAKGIPFGFGGIAKLNTGLLPGALVIKEHYRLGSSMAILSRSFCNTDVITDIDIVEREFHEGVKQIRELEAEAEFVRSYFSVSHDKVVECINNIVSNIEKQNEIR